MEIETFTGKNTVNVDDIVFGKKTEACIDTKGCVYIWPKKAVLARDYPDAEPLNFNSRENVKQ